MKPAENGPRGLGTSASGHNRRMQTERKASWRNLIAAGLLALGLLGTGCSEGDDEVPVEDRQERNVPPGLEEEGEPREEEN